MKGQLFREYPKVTKGNSARQISVSVFFQEGPMMFNVKGKEQFCKGAFSSGTFGVQSNQGQRAILQGQILCLEEGFLVSKVSNGKGQKGIF
jgi:hypothetical protein